MTQPQLDDNAYRTFASDIERRFLVEDVETRNGEGESPTVIAGYAAVFNSPSELMPVKRDDPGGRQFREIVRPGAFAESLVNKRAIFALFQHDSTAVLGSTQNGTLRLSEDNRGLRYEITPPNTTVGRDTVELIRRGDIRASSFGFRVRSGGQSLKRDGEQFVRELRSLELLDVSPVTVGAYGAASVSLRSLDQALLDELESDERAAGRMAMRLALASLR